MGAPALTFHSVTDVGRGREQNEDSCGDVATAGGELVVVCDGMGGHENGEVASRLAVDAILQIFQNSPSSDPAERLKNGFLVANQRILAHAEKAGLDGMGTTAVAAFLKDGEAWVAHVGDSRCYHLRGDSVLWRTLDHTRVQKMIDRGILTPEQAKTHEDANVVTRALGFARGEEQPEPDVASRELRDGDLLLLCSDGLFDLVKDEEIAELGSDDEPAEAAQRLVDLANRRGGHDNITVTIVRFGAAAKRSGGPRKTDLDEPGPGPSAMKTTDVAKSAAAAREIVAREKAKEAAAKESAADPQSKKALGLVIAGIALVGIAAAVFLLTRGGDDEPTKNPSRDAGAASPNTGSGDPTVDPDAGAGSAAAGSADGGALTVPSWTQDKPKGGGGGGGSGKKGSGAGSGSSAGSGSGATAGSGTTAGSGATAGSAATPANTGSGATTGSGGGGGFASKLGVGGGGGSGSGSAATPKAPPGPPPMPNTPTTPQTPPPTTTPPKQPTAQPPKQPAAQPPKQPATTPGVTPPGMVPPTGGNK